MIGLDSRFQAILAAIVHTYLADDARQPLTHVRMDAMRELIRNDAWPEDAPAVRREDLEQLEQHGLVRIERPTPPARWSWLIAPTQEAITTAARHESELALAERAQAVDVSWAAVRPVLHALVAVWERSGASPSGVPLDAIARELDRRPDEPTLLRAVELLEQDGWLEAEYELGATGPLSARPLPKALAGVRGWPSADSQASAERLIAALDELVAREPNEVRRSKLSQLRDFLLDLGSRTVSELLVKAAGGAL